jgi:dTDP-4-amino-4,6-dideoxygalactose transaminase
VIAVPFIDMKGQVAAYRPELDVAIGRVLDSGWFVLGPEVAAFERELAAASGAPDAVAVANGTDALYLGLVALGVGPGHEVVTSPLSATFTALAVLMTGARPVFADVDPKTLNLAPAAVARAVTPRTRAIVPVHLYGHPADMDPILATAREHDIPVLEDACQAVGALYKDRPVGTLGRLGALSFYPTKNLGALGDGGALLVSEPELAPRLRRLRNGGQSDRYRHVEPGINSRLDEMQAAILRVGLGHLGDWTARRRALAGLYRSGLAGLELVLPAEQPYARGVEHLFVVRHRKRDALARGLESRGIGTLVHYPIPLHLQPALASAGGKPGDFPVAEMAANEVLSLPLHPGLSDAQAATVIEKVRETLLELGRGGGG